MQDAPQRAPERSAAWTFKSAQIMAPIRAVKEHADYAAGKAGSVSAAARLIEDTLNADAVRVALAGARPTLAAVHALEAGGVNLIPLAMASRLSVELELPMESALVQINRVGHTGSSGWHRLANPALFAGTVVPGTSYLLLDDFVGQGGTLANLKGHIEAKGGKVVGAVVLTGQQRSARLAVSPEVLQDLRDKHGHIENWWRGRFGFGFDAFTESEARYVLNAESADTIRSRIIAAAQAGGSG